MPSDAVRKSLAVPIGAFRSALALALEQVRAFLSSAAASGAGSAEASLLGSFASGRIDVARFGSLLARAPAANASALARIRDAYEALREAEEQAGLVGEVRAEPGADLREAVARALATMGRAFGAARVHELARTGRYREADHASWLDSFSFERWSRAERMIAPPLVVHVNGRGLRAEPLAEFLDGAMKIVLEVAGESPLVPLVRLVTPGTYVLQTKDATGLDRFAAFAGPGIAAIVPEGSALFVHDPAEGLRIDLLPEPGRIPRGGRSARQEAEELKQLAAMAARPAAPPKPPAVASPETPAPDPADRLAAWLLARADLKDTG
jgi:hypothetical protein